ncbi:MAG: aldehyde dehydrogenase family protein, partial [Verrucomicrobiae bacterium]|nr:aldehyde dehydrogenase family protein [Verrucomicrobiae bacterium]
AGFTASDARGELGRAVQTLRLSADEARHLAGDVLPLGGAPGQEGRLGLTLRVPLGVVLAITPFNSPVNTVLHKIAPAFAAGNAAILKPSPHTPVTANVLADIFAEAGMPDGFLSVLHCGNDTLLALLDQVMGKYSVDPGRVYLTGLSMGGFGTWRLAADHPEMFAAAAPICGRGNPETASRLTKLPIWAWHGTDDPTVPVKNSIDMVEAIQAAGGTKVRFTSLEYIGHASWQAAYQSADLYAWFDKQRASQNQ